MLASFVKRLVKYPLSFNLDLISYHPRTYRAYS